MGVLLVLAELLPGFQLKMALVTPGNSPYLPTVIDYICPGGIQPIPKTEKVQIFYIPKLGLKNCVTYGQVMNNLEQNLANFQMFRFYVAFVYSSSK